jgi:hypothetical protein
MGAPRSNTRGNQREAETKKVPCGTFDICLLEAIDLAKMVGDASFELATPTV